MDISLIPDEVKTLVTVLKDQIFRLGKDWDSLLEPAKKELSQSAIKTISELNDMVHGKPDISAFAGAKILLVDDDSRTLFAMTALLEQGHADVTVAESGPDAIAILERMPDIDIVLIDIMMPGMDGYDTIRAIRTLDHCKTLPIIAVTGKVTSGEAQRCIEAGANDYVPKPVDTAELVTVASAWLPTTARSTP